MTSVNSTCNVTLTCSVEKEEKNVIYSWSTLREEGSVLQIFQTPDNQELTYTCTAWNPVSNNSDSISAQQLCAGIQLCSSFLESHKLLWIAIMNVDLILHSNMPPLCQAWSPGVSRPRKPWKWIQSLLKEVLGGFFFFFTVFWGNPHLVPWFSFLSWH